jgi:hypothetical protein
MKNIPVTRNHFPDLQTSDFFLTTSSLGGHARTEHRWQEISNHLPRRFSENRRKTFF